VEVSLVVGSPAPVQVSARLGRIVFWITRAVTMLAVATQAVLLGIEVTWAVHDHAPIREAAGGQGGLFAATVLLAGVVFWLTAQIGPADPLLRLRRSDGLRLAAVRTTAYRTTTGGSER
jgi:hypothetical protein